MKGYKFDGGCVIELRGVKGRVMKEMGRERELRKNSGERKRQREGERERQTDRHTYRHTDRQRDNYNNALMRNFRPFSFPIYTCIFR